MRTPRPCRFPALAGVALVAAVSVPAIAQVQQGARGASVLKGTVLDSASRPLAGAEIVVTGVAQRVRADSLGAFLVSGIGYGQHGVVIRLMGYDALTTQLVFTGRDTIDAEFELTARAQSLPGVEVKSTALVGPNADFDRRRHSSPGVFFTRAELAKYDDRKLSDLLRQHVPGIKLIVDPRMGRVWLVGGQGSSASLTGLPPGDPNDAKSPRACYSQVYLNGGRMYAPSALRTTMVVPDLDQFEVSQLAAVEYYSGPATTPPEFGGAGVCGTLVLWTRTGT